ncbi:hypothetical protein BC832DRAFT_554151 [Gaertneriomyces semiglobifer]|nr:hypothetical protein BC832DRAFT_554151 [Gaertneriomyces semiglobifer]
MAGMEYTTPAASCTLLATVRIYSPCFFTASVYLSASYCLARPPMKMNESTQWPTYCTVRVLYLLYIYVRSE